MKFFLFISLLLRAALASREPLDLCTPDLPHQRFHVGILFLCIRGTASNLLVQQLDHLKNDVLHCRDDFCLVESLCRQGPLEAELAKYLTADNLMREIRCLAKYCTTSSDKQPRQDGTDYTDGLFDLPRCANSIVP